MQRVILYYAHTSDLVLQQLVDNLFFKKDSIQDVFDTSLVFANNTFSKTYIEKRLLCRDVPFPFVSNVHFLKWAPHMESLLENESSVLFTGNAYWVVLWVLFLQEDRDFHKNILNTQKDEDLFRLAEFYIQLFMEYEIYSPATIAEWKKRSVPLLSKQEEQYCILYHAFWEWYHSKQDIFDLSERNSFSYPVEKLLKFPYRDAKSVHIIMPQYVLQSQLEMIYDIFCEDQTLCIYILNNPHIVSIGSKKSTLLEHINAILNDLAQRYSVPYQTTQITGSMKKKEKIYPCYSYKTLQAEYTGLLYHIHTSLQQTDDMLDQYAVIVSQRTYDHKTFLLNFEPYKQELPYHMLFDQQYEIRKYNLLEVILFFPVLVEGEFQLKDLQIFLNFPLILSLLDITKEAVESFLSELQYHGFWGDSSKVDRAQRLSFFLLQELMSSYVSPKYEMRTDFPREKLYHLIQQLYHLRICYLQSWMTKEVLEEWQRFLSSFIPIVFLQEIQDHHLQQNIIFLQSICDFLQNIPHLGDLKLQNQLMFQIIEHIHANRYTGETLWNMHSQGIIVGQLQDFDAFPLSHLYFSGFSELLDLSPKYLYHAKSTLSDREPKLTEIMKYAPIQLFLEILSESSDTVFSYSQLEPDTREMLQRHFMLEYLQVVEKEPISYQKLPPLSDSANIPLQPENILFSKTGSNLIRIANLKQFLKTPLLYYWKRLYHDSEDFLHQEGGWSLEPYFFSWSYPYERHKLVTQLLYQISLNQNFDIHQIAVQQGLLRDSMYNISQLKIIYAGILEIFQTMMLQTPYEGRFVHKILIGDVQLLDLSPDITCLNFPPLEIDEIQIMGEISHVYIAERDDLLSIHFPLYTGHKNNDPMLISPVILLKAFVLFLCFPHSQLEVSYTLEVEKSGGKSAIETHRRSFFRIDVETYLRQLIHYITQGVTHPWSYRDISGFCKSRDKVENHRISSSDEWWQDWNPWLTKYPYKEGIGALLPHLYWDESLVFKEIKDCYGIFFPHIFENGLV